MEEGKDTILLEEDRRVGIPYSCRRVGIPYSWRRGGIPYSWRRAGGEGYHTVGGG